MLTVLTYGSEDLWVLVFLTHPIQHIAAYMPFLAILFIMAYKSEFLKNNGSNRLSDLIVLFIGTWIFLVFLRFLGYLEVYNNPDSAQIYGNFTYIFVLLTVLLVTCLVIQKMSETKRIHNGFILSFLLLGFMLNQIGVFHYHHPMNSKVLPLNDLNVNEKLLVWDRDTNDFNINTSNWLIHFTIPYSNTRWVNSNYFPLLKTLPLESQITKITQRYAYEGVVKKASNYKNNYFDSNNSVLIEDLIKSKSEKN
jgi:hypothetical protein